MGGVANLRTPRTATEKFCTRCEQFLPFSEYGERARSADGLQVWCKPCMRMYQREKAYGLTPDEINALLAEGCAVCGTHEQLCIDHCHRTGRVRKALCDRQNRALEVLKENAEHTAALLLYIEEEC